MDILLARISDKTNGTERGFGSVFSGLIEEIKIKYKGNETEIDKRIKMISVIRHTISKQHLDREQQMMILCNGSISEFNELKKASISQYLAKFENYVQQIEALNKK